MHKIISNSAVSLLLLVPFAWPQVTETPASHLLLAVSFYDNTNFQ